VPKDAFLLLSVGELNANKNHQIIIRALERLNNPKVHYVIAGVGDKREYLLNLAAELGISEQVHLLGYRKDVAELYKTVDVFVFPSFREGLSASVMEAMASGLPIVCSCIRGNIDLIDENGGEMFDPHSIEDCTRAIKKIIQSNKNDKGNYNLNKVGNLSEMKVNSMIRRIIENL